jgi:predicted transcriptional regulator
MPSSKGGRAREPAPDQAPAPATAENPGNAPDLTEALSDVKKGNTIPAEDVEAWIESWDTPDELPMPKPSRR